MLLKIDIPCFYSDSQISARLIPRLISVLHRELHTAVYRLLFPTPALPLPCPPLPLSHPSSPPLLSAYNSIGPIVYGADNIYTVLNRPGFHSDLYKGKMIVWFGLILIAEVMHFTASIFDSKKNTIIVL